MSMQIARPLFLHYYSTVTPMAQHRFTGVTLESHWSSTGGTLESLFTLFRPSKTPQALQRYSVTVILPYNKISINEVYLYI